MEQGQSEVLGYYTLSANSISLDLLPVAAQRRLPRYGAIPSVLLGRMAVATMMQGRGLGESLLGNAVELACKYGVAWAMFLVSAKHDAAALFYRRYGFNALESNPLLLWASRKEVMKLF